MTISALPTAPSRTDPATFSSRADALLGALPTMVTELNAAIAGETALGLASDLASTTAGKGAALVKFQAGSTVQDLASTTAGKGAALVVYKSAVGGASRTVQARLDDVETLRGFGAAGTGTGNDTAALTAVAAAVKWGVSGGWSTYAVTDTTHIGLTRQALYLKGGVIEIPQVQPAEVGGSYSVNRFGGQLAELLRRLTDPLCQSVNINFSGDSITWGSGATGSATSTPRDATLSDPRDVFATCTWVNNVKRWVGQLLGTGATVALTNHAASPSGESIATWTKSIAIYPTGPRFTTKITGTATDTHLTDIAALANRKRSLSVIPSAKAQLTFKFTGTTIEVVFACITNGANYNLRVNGVTVASAVPTRVGASGLTAGYGRSNIHTFARVVDAVVELEAVHHDNVSGTDSLYIEALRLPKTVRLSNNACIGITSAGVLSYHMPTAREAGDGLRPIAQIASVVETPTGTTSKAERPDAGSSTGMHTLYGVATSAQYDIVVPVGSTKNMFEIRYGSAPNGADVDVLVASVVIASFATSSLAPGGAYGSAKRRVITLPGGTTSVTVRAKPANYGGGAAYTNYLQLEGIASYVAADVTYPTTNSFGDGLSFAGDDDFGIFAIGTNDRIDADSIITSPQALSANVEAIIDLMPRSAAPIIITPAPAETDGPPTYFMSAREAGSALRELAQRRGIDVINLQGVFGGVHTDVWTSDGLHPNDLGHKLYAAAVINAIESSS